MNAKQIEVYRTYKELYPGALILFHLEDCYVSLMDDAKIVAQSLPSMAKQVSENCVVLSDTCYIQAMLKLGDEGHAVKTIEYRNDKKQRDFPDLNRLNNEKKEDF